MLPASGGNLSGGCNSAGSSSYDLTSSGILLELNFFKVHFIGWSPNVDHCQNWRARQLTALNSYKRHDRDLAQLRPAQPAQAAAPVAGPGLYFTLMDHQHPGYCSIQSGKFPNLNNRQVAHKMDAGIFINYHNSDHISFCSTARLCWCTAVPQ